MRAYRLLPIAVALAALTWPATQADAGTKRNCSVPRGWRVVARDSYAVVIRNTQTYPTYRYCSRARGRFRPLASTGPANPNLTFQTTPQTIDSLQLRGRYIAYSWVLGSPGFEVDLFNAVTGRRVSHPVAAGVGELVSGIVLSRNGLVAWIWDGNDPTATGDHRWEELDALTLNHSTQLDYAVAGRLEDLQLWDCAASCAPMTTLVAWTEDGAQRYAQVTGSSS